MASSSINGNNHQASKFGIQHHFHEHHHHHPHDQQQHHQNNQISFEMMQASNSSSNIIPGNYIGRDAGSMDLVDVDSPFYLYHQLENQEPPQLNDQRQNNSSMTPHTLNIFPSQPMHAVAEPLQQSGVSKITNGAGSSSSTEPSMELSNKGNNNNGIAYAAEQPNKTPKREGKGKTPMTSDGEHGGAPKDPKTLRRLAQNREAARKSRLRKKAYVQQLESSRIRLSQLEQEIQRARAQGFMIGGNNGLLGGDPSVLALNNNLSGSAFFDNEYMKWLEDHTRLMHELRAAVEEHLPEHDLRGYVDNCLVHLEQVSNLKDLLSKVDVLHLVTGTWTTPAERHLMWIGGFRPSHIFKVILNHIEPLTETQLMNICALQASTVETEEKMNNAFEIHRRILIDTIAAGSLHPPNNANDYNNHLFSAMTKVSNIEPLARQAENLRHSTLLRLRQILTTRQTARCLLAISEYCQRLRALSSLWVTRGQHN